MSVLPDSITQDLCHTFSFDKNQDLYPISNHRKYDFFSENKVKKHAKEKVCIADETDEECIEGASKEGSKSFLSSNIGIKLEAISLVAEAEANSETSTSSENLHRIVYSTKKKLSHFGPFKTKKDLKEHLTEDPYNSLITIKSKEDASKFIQNYGRFFISTANIGGLSISFGRTQTHATTTNRGCGLKIRPLAPIPATKVKTGIRGGRGTGASEDWEETKARKIGGNTMLEDEEKWKHSINDKNCAICKCTFEPLYKLIDSTRSEIPEIRKYLEQAHDDYIPEEGNCKIKNVLDRNTELGPIFIVSEPREDKPMKPMQGESRYNVFTHFAQRRSGHRLEWVSSFHANYRYFGRRKRVPEQVKMSGEANSDPKNEWILKKIPECKEERFWLCFEREKKAGMLMLRVLQKMVKANNDSPVECEKKKEAEMLMLGVRQKAVKANNNSPVEYEYYVDKFKDNKTTLNLNFKWTLVDPKKGEGEHITAVDEVQVEEKPQETVLNLAKYFILIITIMLIIVPIFAIRNGLAARHGVPTDNASNNHPLIPWYFLFP